ncbi:dipeptidase PepV [Fusobacterium sp.]|uniref:dipeptidase PepV n=1 Tax=Fusobacterium sp. TaxID=68766 RepID=UPI002617B449|nr:dipeptidase PepV [Fusobacterium sp.]
MSLQEKVLVYKDDVIKSIQGAIQIKSVMEEAKEGMPFGEGPAKALNYFVELGKDMGFEVINYDNYVATIEFGEGEEVLGILGHVDVVPEGEGWDYPPYSGALVDGRIYGRGTLDDKGPSTICLYAMKAIKDSGVKLNKRVRMILGANEESGSKCMEHYFGTLKMPQPTLAFTPDSNFPVTFAEKGIVRVRLKNNYSTLANVSLSGGNAFNSVPERCELTIPVDYLEGVAESLVAYNESREYKIECEEKNGNYHINSYGKSAHASKPYLGYNSVSALFEFLREVKVKNEEFRSLVEFFNTCIKMDIDGKSLGVNFEDDESGKLTLNIGKTTLKDGILEICIDIRCPVKVENKKVIEIIKERASKFMEVELAGDTAPLYVAKDSFLVSTLMNVYKDVTGDVESQPIAIGGGTYARSVTNGVAFGALLSSQVDNMHQKNEYLEVDKIDTLLKIYVEAIYQLAK